MTGARTPSMRFALAMSVDLRAARLHDRRPAGELCLEHRRHLLGAAWNEVVAKILHALAELGRSGAPQRGGVQLADDLLRRAGGRGNPEPDARFIARHTDRKSTRLNSSH